MTNIIEDTSLGSVERSRCTTPSGREIQMYREYIPITDQIEFTVFWRGKDAKNRIDLRCPAERGAQYENAAEFEQYVIGCVSGAIELVEAIGLIQFDATSIHGGNPYIAI